MQDDYALSPPDLQQAPVLADTLRHQLTSFLTPLLLLLDQHLDVRLVRTFRATLEAILCFRNRAMGLLLSELGAYLLSPDKAPAGTKRLSNLLRSGKWQAGLLAEFLWQQAQKRLQDLETAGEQALCVWDSSVLEKTESRTLEGLCPVRSSKAARCLRIKPGFWHPPTQKPVFVPGMQWLCLLLMGLSGRVEVAAMQWWSSRAEHLTNLRQEQSRLLVRCAHAWGPRVRHLFDRGYAGSPWLGALLGFDLRFVLRWPKRLYLCDKNGKPQNAWKIARGKRSWEKRLVWDARKRVYGPVGVLALPVTHPDYPDHCLWLVVARPGGGRQPWYLLTNERIETAQEAWSIVFAYARRWQIEMSFRYNKSELAMESPRLWRWENRQKLLLMVTLCYAFLLSLLEPLLQPVCQWLLRHFCHRTGKRSQEVSAPLYRLRAALSRLWLSYPGLPVQMAGINSG